MAWVIGDRPGQEKKVDGTQATVTRKLASAADRDLGVYGLSVMGSNLARNAARRGFKVAVYNRNSKRTQSLMEEFGSEGDMLAFENISDFVASLSPPRAILIMVKAGDGVQSVIEALAPLLGVGDVIIDGGNSLFEDSNLRSATLRKLGVSYLGMGISGGEEGALNGPCLMAGGDRDAYDRVAPIFEQMAAKVDDIVCCAYVGPQGAGHYVKMVHNGIEYAFMQLLAEAYDLMRSVYRLEATAIADVFHHWGRGRLASYLVDATEIVLRKRDIDTGRALVDMIRDVAEEKGTGRWTARNALDLGVPLTATTQAVHARVLSSQVTLRALAASTVSSVPGRPDRLQAAIADIEDAAFAAQLIAYAQGFEQMAAASTAYGWDLDLARIATIWRGGCIIRADLLESFREAFSRDANLTTVIVEPSLRSLLNQTTAGWRRVVALAVAQALPLPVLASSLAYFDGLTQERGPASLIQALRDHFGAHGYARTDRPGAFHTRWDSGASTLPVEH